MTGISTREVSVRDSRSVAAKSGWVITDAGRQALAGDTCKCQPTIQGNFLLCRDCGTVYGLLSQAEFGRKPSWSDKH
jgi:hypothetical protein